MTTPMIRSWAVCAVLVGLTVAIANAYDGALFTPQSDADKFDSLAYAGLIGSQERARKLTQDPRDATVSVSDVTRPRKHDDPVLALPPEFRTIVTAACASDLVVLARSIAEEPFLNPAETWVLTRHRLKVSQLISAKGHSRDATSTLVYAHPSGSMVLAGRRITTRVTAYPPLKEGEDYIFFLRRVPQTGHYSAVLEIPVLAGGHQWVAYADLDVEVPKGLRAGVAYGDLLSQVSAAGCHGAR